MAEFWSLVNKSLNQPLVDVSQSVTHRHARVGWQKIVPHFSHYCQLFFRCSPKSLSVCRLLLNLMSFWRLNQTTVALLIYILLYGEVFLIFCPLHLNQWGQATHCKHLTETVWTKEMNILTFMKVGFIAGLGVPNKLASEVYYLLYRQKSVM